MANAPKSMLKFKVEVKKATFNQDMDKEKTLYRYVKLVTPSLLSGAVSVLLPLLVVLVTLLSIRLQGSVLQNELYAIHQASIPVMELYGVMLSWVDSRQYIMNIPIAIFWVVLGLVTYTIVVEVIRLFDEALHIEREMHYVHSNPGAIVRDLVIRFLLRMSAAVGLLSLAPYTFGPLIKEQVAAAKTLAAVASMATAMPVAGITGLFMLSLLIQTALLRLLFLRVRLFGDF